MEMQSNCHNTHYGPFLIFLFLVPVFNISVLNSIWTYYRKEIFKWSMKKVHALQICPFSHLCFHAWRVSEKRKVLLLYLIQYHEHGGERLRLEMTLMIHCVPGVKIILWEFPLPLETDTGLVYPLPLPGQWCTGDGWKATQPTMKSFPPSPFFFSW